MTNIIKTEYAIKDIFKGIIKHGILYQLYSNRFVLLSKYTNFLEAPNSDH